MADEQKEVKLAGGVFADEEAAIAAASQLAQELAEEPPAEDDGEVVEEALSGTGEDSGEDEDTPPRRGIQARFPYHSAGEDGSSPCGDSRTEVR
jgi:hypothetical protein